MVTDEVNTREISRFSFVVIESEDGSVEKEKRYILKFDRDVNGYSFLGGSIRAGEKPQDTVFRALRETVNNCAEEVPEGEWKKLFQALVPCPEISKNVFKLPYVSVRTQNDSEGQEMLAELHLYRVLVSKENYPGLFAQLMTLTSSKTDSLRVESPSEYKIFSSADLAVEAWSNPDNPFIRFLFKKDILHLPESELLSAPYLLHPPTLEYSLERLLSALFIKLVPDEMLEETLDVTVCCPGIDEVSLCLQANRTLRATIEVRWSGSAKVLHFTFPFPYQGVFILHSDTSLDGQAGTWIWHPRLVGIPGLWKLRKHLNKKGERACAEYFRLIISGTNYHDFQEYPTQQAITKKIGKNFFPPATQEVNGKNFEDRPSVHVCNSSDEALDDQDIFWQRLYTYSALLVDKLIAFVARNAQSKKNDVAVPLWTTLCRFKSPVRLIAISNYINSGWLHFFDPQNNLDALSRLTSLQRYAYQHIERLPPIYRQNHPSYLGIICPVETPESIKVGITLHLTRGTRTDAQGFIHRPLPDETGDLDLGYGASLVPFYQHNDGPRAMMGAKNLKQAVPIKMHTPPFVTTGHEKTVQLLTSPQRNLGIIPRCDTATPGVDLLVAYMPWYGWNMEDAIVANQRLVDEGILDWETMDARSAYILPGYKPTAPVFQNTFAEAFKVLSYAEDGLRKIGRINPQDPLVFFKDAASGATVPLLFGDEHPGELMDVKFIDPPDPLLGGSLRWSIRRSFPLMVGDKLMGRYGNKGVVSLICAPDNLPRLPDDQRLPEELRGRAIDLILNPHGVISRMNLGQLLETSIGLLSRLDFSGTHFSPDIGRAFQSMDWEFFQQGIQKVNGAGKTPFIDEYGRIFLTLPGGKPTTAPVVVGFQHIVRLKHVAAKKAHVRGWPGGQGNHLPYNAITGQPVRGKRRKGGQRIGEMEIWALAANQASANLTSIVTTKSDPAVSGKKPFVLGQTFQSIKDHLLAMGVELQQNEQGSVRISWLSSQAIEELGKEVTNEDMWDVGMEGIYRCPNEKCAYHCQRMRTTGNSERGNKRITVQDVLRHQGFQLAKIQKEEAIPSGIANKEPREMPWVLEPLSETSGRKEKNVTFQYSRTKGTVRIDFKINRISYCAYMQKKSAEPIPCHAVAQFWLSCPKHSSAHLICEEVTPRIFPAPGGLCDESVFGPVNVSDWNPNSWGYIKLPEPVSYPSSPPFHFGKNDVPLALNILPVLPLKYRFRGFSKIGTAILPQPEKLTAIYQEILALIKQKKTLPKKIEECVNELFTLLHGRLFGKFGLLRRAALGRRVDTSGRLVIVPDPTLPWDACGVPTEVLISLLGPKIAAQPEILREFAQNAWADLLVKAIFNINLEVPTTIEELLLNEDFWTICPGIDKLTQAHLQLAHSIIERYLEKFPDTTVILNRQPSLHRYSIMGFRPIPLPPEDGMALKINPLVCKGFGADFDGDEMAIHLPWSDEEQQETENMKPTQKWNLVSWANNQPLANFDQDFVAGHFLLSLDDKAKKELREVLDKFSELQSGCQRCHQLMDVPSPWKKVHGNDLLLHLCTDHAEQAGEIIPQWMQLAFRVVTEHGLSFGFLELKKLQNDYSKETQNLLDAIPPNPDASKLASITKDLGDMVLKKLDELAKQAATEPGHGFATLAVSGARGAKQVRQLISARGLLAPGDTGFEFSPIDFFIQESLVAGMTPRSSFMAAMNARSSMLDKKLGTGKAGALTRALVLAGWEWTVQSGDCGVTGPGERMLTRCLWQGKRTICSACYGKIHGHDTVPDGYPAGLIAAQSFGERGTQLSMQSFHTAEKQLSIDEIVTLLNGRDIQTRCLKGNAYNWFVQEEDAEEFVKRIQQIKSYEDLDPRHLLLIWLIIHQSSGNTVTSAWEENRTAIAGLIGPGQWKFLLKAIHDEIEDDLMSPFARIMTSQIPCNMVKGEVTRQ